MPHKRKGACEIYNHPSYWKQRLEGRRYNVIKFRKAYATKAPEMQVEFWGVRKYCKGRSGYYAIRFGRILKLKRWKK